MDTEILSVDKIIEAFKASYPDTVFYWDRKTDSGWYVRTNQGPRRIKWVENDPSLETARKAYMAAIKYMNFTHGMATEYWKNKVSQPIYRPKKKKPALLNRWLIIFTKITLSKNTAENYYIILTREKYNSLFGSKKAFNSKREEIYLYVTKNRFLKKNKTVFVFVNDAASLVNTCFRKKFQITETLSLTKVE